MEEYSQNLEKNLEDLEMEVETLNAMLNELLKRVSKEKDRGLKALPDVDEWISTAEKVELKASSLLDESISECHSLTTYDDCSNISESTLHYSETVCVTLEEVKALRSKGVFKVLVERAPLSHVRKKTPIQPIVSQEMLLEKAWKCLEENECRTLGLYGMAGVGKTTLLTQLKNKCIEVWDVTCIVIFVDVEYKEVKGIQDTIMKILGIFFRKKSEWENKSEIYEVLNRRRFVLLLDGVQREGVDLEAIGVPLPSRDNGSKVIFTTRYQEEACRRKWVDAALEVKCLSPEEAWVLFQEMVGETTLKSHPDIPQLARIVARKCGGFPIALRLIGEAMSRKRAVREWHHAIHALVSSTTKFLGSQVAILRFMLTSGFRELSVSDCNIPEITIDWRSLIQRETVHSGNIEKIPQFLNIRTVSLFECKGLRDLTWLLYAPSLEDLDLLDCPHLEQVVSKEKAMEQLSQTSEHPFQNLVRLSLFALPLLESIYWAPLPFPVLQYLNIQYCPKLRRLPLDSDSAKGNQVRLYLEERWIKGVEWEDEATKQRVSHLNNIIYRRYY